MLNTVPRPLAALGHYGLSMQTGVMAAGISAASDIFQFRWTDTRRICVLLGIRLEGMWQETGFTAGGAIFQATVARGYSANGTGGLAATMTGDNQQRRTNMETSLVGDIRIATTAALGAGTKTYEAHDSASYMKMILAAANTQVFEPFWLWRPDLAIGESPIILSANEGFGIRATVPATGTWRTGIRVAWAEMERYPL